VDEVAETSGLRTANPTTTSSTILVTAKDVEKLFIKRIVERKKTEAEKRRGEIHLTDLTSDCLRRVWYDKHDPLPDDAPDIIRMWQGEVMHEMPLLKEHELELEYKGVKTRVDEYEDGILVEKKFVNFVPRTREELAKYYSHYVKQVEYEALFLTANGREVRKAFLLFVKRGEPEEGRPPLIAFEIPVELERVRARFDEELARLKDVLASGVPPEIPKDYGPFDYPCTYCKYRPRCYGA
jgi:hypothetical protein